MTTPDQLQKILDPLLAQLGRIPALEAQVQQVLQQREELNQTYSRLEAGLRAELQAARSQAQQLAAELQAERLRNEEFASHPAVVAEKLRRAEVAAAAAAQQVAALKMKLNPEQTAESAKA